MAVIDLKEIPEAHIADGDQDRFELFARDFLEALGFRIIQGPGRGADRGRDLLVGEAIGGTVTATERIWLVSAKHKAHSGRSVSDADEIDPIGRVRRFGADGFMPFYYPPEQRTGRHPWPHHERRRRLHMGQWPDRATLGL